LVAVAAFAAAALWPRQLSISDCCVEEEPNRIIDCNLFADIVSMTTAIRNLSAAAAAAAAAAGVCG